MGLKRLIVGIDGSEHAGRALQWATGLAQQTGAEVVAVHVVGLRVPTDAGPAPSGSEHDHLVALLEGEWTEELHRMGVVHRCRLEDGSPVTTILDVAAEDEEDADLVVPGSRGAGAFSELLGSTSHQVALNPTGP